MAQQFGGRWTEEKLKRLQKYLAAYTIIFNNNERARKLHFMYVDAFAGTGSFQKPQSYVTGQADIFSDDVTEVEEFLKGSARIALEIDPPFREYIFVERNPEYAQQLQQLKDEFAGHKIQIVNEDANSYLLRWCESTNWKTARAVVFLDPYGMEVEWNVIEALARTEAVDLWYLFPLGIGVNRLLTRSGPPPEPWAERLTRIFGTEDWRDAFYRSHQMLTLFGDDETQLKKDADFHDILRFFVQRLETVFEAVAPNPLILRNSRNNPLYALCFAASNPRGAPTALKIAEHILGKKKT